MSKLARLRRTAGLESVSRRNLSEVAKTLAFVVPMTLLIWVYAERAQTLKADVAVPLAFTVADPTLVATIKEPAVDQVTLRLSGPRGQIEAFKRRLEDLGRDRVSVQLPATYAAAGDYDLPLDRVLNDDPFFAYSGVTILREGTSPPAMKVNVDRLDTRDATVVLPRNPGQPLENVKFDPARVTFRGPQAAIERQFPPRDATVAVTLPDQLLVGQNRTLDDLPLDLHMNPAITATHQRVRMSYDILSRKVPGVVQQVRVDVQRPLGQDGKSRVVMRGPPVLNNVQITGPENEVRDYAGDKATKLLTGVITIDQSDIGKTDVDKTVTFPTLPRGIEIDGGPYTVKVDVTASNDADR